MLFLLFTQLALAAFQPNDISILLPLPKKGEEARMWGPESGDVLLPGEVFKRLPEIVTDLDPETLYKKSLKVLAVRIDPCFREGNEPCRRQIRFVFQPLVFEENRFTTLDAAIHTFYELNESQWNGMVTALPKGAAGSLSVHPTLKKEGYAGDTWKKLQTILKFCNPVTLKRATVMTVNPLGNIWFFSGLHVDEGVMNSINIPRVKAFTQGFFTAMNDLDGPEFRVAMDPAPHEQGAFLKLLRHSAGAKEMGEKNLQEATREAIALENPRLTHPGNVDCASCHGARLAEAWAMRNFPDWNWRNLFEKELYSDEGVVFLPEAKTTPANVLRMFGYFEDEPVIARRVEFETRESLKSF